MHNAGGFADRSQFWLIASDLLELRGKPGDCALFSEKRKTLGRECTRMHANRMQVSAARSASEAVKTSNVVSKWRSSNSKKAARARATDGRHTSAVLLSG